jgi:16S rRNA (cytidine1402-2'-O)-methyltransferase
MDHQSPQPVQMAERPSGAGPGTLYLVGTPIGNLGDLPPRVRDILSAVDLVAAEDTRRTLRLCNYLGLKKRLESYHEHNRRSKEPLLLALLQQGQNIALVSDAGMPCISDPGEQLVQRCIEEAIAVVVIPGPCAAVVGLAGSGLATDRFTFEGFLPTSGKQRQQRVRQLALESRTCILYEAPHRLGKTLADLAGAGLSERQLTLARELTKLHEEFFRTSVGGALAHYGQHEPRGEFVLVMEGLDAFQKRIEPVGPANSPASDDTPGESGDPAGDSAAGLLRDLIAQGMSSRDAAREVALQTGRKKNELYQMALKLQGRDDSESASLL